MVKELINRLSPKINVFKTTHFENELIGLDNNKDPFPYRFVLGRAFHCIVRFRIEEYELHNLKPYIANVRIRLEYVEIFRQFLKDKSIVGITLHNHPLIGKWIHHDEFHPDRRNHNKWIVIYQGYFDSKDTSLNFKLVATNIKHQF